MSWSIGANGKSEAEVLEAVQDLEVPAAIAGEGHEGERAQFANLKLRAETCIQTGIYGGDLKDGDSFGCMLSGHHAAGGMTVTLSFYGTAKPVQPATPELTSTTGD